MAVKNIEININTGNNQYDTLYPKTTFSNVEGGQSYVDGKIAEVNNSLNSYQTATNKNLHLDRLWFSSSSSKAGYHSYFFDNNTDILYNLDFIVIEARVTFPTLTSGYTRNIIIKGNEDTTKSIYMIQVGIEGIEIQSSIVLFKQFTHKSITQTIVGFCSPRGTNSIYEIGIKGSNPNITIESEMASTINNNLTLFWTEITCYKYNAHYYS